MPSTCFNTRRRGVSTVHQLETDNSDVLRSHIPDIDTDALCHISIDKPFHLASLPPLQPPVDEYRGHRHNGCHQSNPRLPIHDDITSHGKGESIMTYSKVNYHPTSASYSNELAEEAAA